MKVLALYNICGISGHQNIPAYIDSIKSILAQKGFGKNELRLVVSSCLSSEYVEKQLYDVFGSSISYNWIDESLPLTVTFNHSLQKCVAVFGPSETYLYVDSGINFHCPMNRNDALLTMYEAHKSNHFAITATMPSNDDGHQWWDIHYPDEGNFIFPVGKTTNLHCQLYDEKMRLAYNGKLHCDIFANDTSESVTSFLTAAIGMKFQILMRPVLFHNQSMDGASIGWRGRENNLARLFVTRKTMDERYNEGHEYGFGYEECNGQQNWLHDPDKFDDEGNAKDPRLLEFLKRELFLSQEEFDYDKIIHRFVPQN